MVRVIGRTLAVLFRSVRFLLPWILRILWATITLMGTAIASLWIGVPTATRRIAESWVDRAARRGFPTELDRTLYFMGRGVAFVTIVAGWIVTSYVTVWLINWLLHR